MAVSHLTRRTHNILLSTIHFVVDIMFGTSYCVVKQEAITPQQIIAVQSGKEWHYG